MSWQRATALGLLAATVALAALGQFYFFYRPEYLWDAVAFDGLAVLCFILAWRCLFARPERAQRAPKRTYRLVTWLHEQPALAGLIGLGLFLSATATLLSRDRTWNQDTHDVVIFWLLGIGAVTLAAFWPVRPRGRRWNLSLRRWPSRLRSVSRETWLEFATVIGLTLLAFVLRATALDSVPYVLGGDEAWHGLLARQVLHGELRNPFVMGYMSMPTLFYWPLSWSLWAVGDNLVGLRLPAVLAGTATVPVLYLFARRLWGRRIACLAAAFLATYDYHIHYSRLGANNVWDPLFVVLTLWLVDRGLTGEPTSKGSGRERIVGRGEAGGRAAGSQGIRRWACLLGAGLLMGLSFYFYTGARSLPVLVIAYVAFLWIEQRAKRLPRRLPEQLGPLLALMALAFLVAATPILSFALAHPDEWNARLNQVGILQSGWLAREPGLTGKSTWQLLADQFLRAAGAFHAFPDRTVWYGADRPLLGFLAGALALLGMAWAVVHWRERRHFLVLLWFWTVIITGGMLTESPPSSQRLVMAIPAVSLLVAIGLERLVHLAQRLLNLERRWADLALGLLALGLAAGSVHYYFVQFTPARRYGGENGETATMIGHYLSGLDGDYRAYLLGAPRLYWSFGSMAFLAPNVPGQDVVEPLQATPDFVDTAHGAVFLFLPERAGELVWVQQAFPQGRLREFHDAGGRLRFIAYEVTSPVTPTSFLPQRRDVVPSLLRQGWLVQDFRLLGSPQLF